MKFFTLPALFVAALLSALVVAPFLPAAKTSPDRFGVEAKLTSTTGGQFQIFYDQGAGVREELSGHATLTAGPDLVTYRLPLPPGVYRGLRLDPLDRGGTVTLASLRIVSPGGRTLRDLPLADLKPLQQIQSLTPRDGTLTITTAPNGNDPQLTLAFAEPVIVKADWSDAARDCLSLVLPVFVAFAAVLFILDRAAGLRVFLATTGRSLTARPGRAVSVVAALAVLASAYPVVFLGKSYVSPNLGTYLLYDSFPTLPGYKSGELTDVKLSDIGAVMWQHVPFSMMQHRALAGGELPLWNRYSAGGVPLLAQGQSMFGDPLHLFVIAADGAAWAWDLKYLVAKWLFAAGLGFIVLALTRPSATPGGDGVAPPASAWAPALIVAFAAPFIGFFLYRVNHPAFFSLCYAPWPLYCLVRVAQASTRREVTLWTAGLIVADFALMNSGTVKEAYMLLVSMNFSGACVVVASDGPWRVRFAKLAALAWGGVIFVLLTFPIWATFLQTLKNAYTSYNSVSAYQIQPTLLLGAFDEIFYRPLMTKDQVFSPSLNFLLLGGVLYFLATLREHFTQRAVVALALSSLPPLALAFGLIPPQWIVRLPFLANVAHIDNTFSCVLLVLWSVLAGIGFATAARRLGTPEGRHDLVVAGLLLFALVFGWIAFRQVAHRPIYGPIVSVNLPGQSVAVTPFIWGYLATLLVALVALGLAVRSALRRRALSSACAVLIVGCTLPLVWRHGLHAGAMGFETFTSRPTVRADFHARSEAMEFLRTGQQREPFRGFGFHSNFHPGWTGVYGLETIHGPDALVNPFMRELVTTLTANPAIERWWDWRVYVEVANAGAVRPFFDALNVRYYLDLHSDQAVLGKALKLVKAADLDVYESPTAWPRAFFTDRVEAYDRPADFVEKIRTGDGRPFAMVQRDDLSHAPALLSLPRGLADRTVAPASDYVLTENTTSFTVRANSAGVIVLNEVFWPGDFRATVNGHKAPVHRLNHTFKGVAVDGPGEYRIVFSYVPKNWPRNLALCALGVGLLALSLWLGIRSASAPVAPRPVVAPPSAG